MSGLAMQTENENLVDSCSRRPHNCKTGYFTSLIGRERQEIVQNEKYTCIACKSFFFVIVKYANLCHSRRRRRRGLLKLPTKIYKSCCCVCEM